MQSLLPENYRESESEGTEEMQNYAGQLPGVLTGQELHQLPLQEMSGHWDDAGADPGQEEEGGGRGEKRGGGGEAGG